jgi:aspartyl-tRNA synthetase
MFTWDDGEAVAANHHPFTPRGTRIDKLESDPGKVLAKAYDLVCNGYEVGGGIRIHRQDVQSRVFQILGMHLDDARAGSASFGRPEERRPTHGGMLGWTGGP